MAGVPLGSPAQMFDNQMRNFKIDPQLRADFNAYVEATRTGRVPPTNGKGNPAYAEMFPTEEQPRHALETLIFTHYAYFLQWHKQTLGHAHELSGMQANTNASKYQDIEDIRGADEELQKEIRFLEDKNPRKFEDVDDPAIEAVLNVSNLAASTLGALNPMATAYHAVKIATSSQPLVKQGVLNAMHEKQRQWDLALRDVWHGQPQLTGKPAVDVKKLFECYVHDSRAWFKPLVAQYKASGLESKVVVVKSLLRLSSYGLAPDDEDWFTLGDREKELKSQIADLEKMLEKQKAARDRNGQQDTEAKLARLKEQGPLIRGGREPYRMYGYLRHRKVYQSGQLNETAYDQGQKAIQKDEDDRRKQQRIEEENARHQKARDGILKEEQRVKKEHPNRYDEYRYGSQSQLAREDEFHAERLGKIAQEH
jgi:hypothetical protein